MIPMQYLVGLSGAKMEDETVSQLTAREFFKEWYLQHPLQEPLTEGLTEDEWLEFAEAYATASKQYQFRCFELIREKDDELKRRATELLRSNAGWPEEAVAGTPEWEKLRAEWLKDAGVEEK
jgi:hypothetical protein